MSMARLRERLSRVNRGDEDRIPIAAVLPADGTRSLSSPLLKGFRLLNIQFPDDLAGHIAASAARPLMAYYEKCLKPGPGLYSINRNGRLTPYPPGAVLPAAEDPYLVLLHGTFMTTGSSFGRLLASTDWADLCDVYGPRIVGFNHHTLTESPAQNALELVQRLPRRARLHLLTHSRGGLVGELLAHGPLPTPRTLRAAQE
jgi:hypothetical protein